MEKKTENKRNERKKHGNKTSLGSNGLSYKRIPNPLLEEEKILNEKKRLKLITPKEHEVLIEQLQKGILI